ncbi:UNKNOWN [Stylonychia lemnae]|uniref:Uncharacterized protein n=1 Tax=Stylonychia lemnae TaxID=5949 RepID=A0A078AMQ7_STYLE|nr:UNKNOWN [Stylonychia lemnae]|eukprot:CDW83201.1 UNKNOWN [Stylonychia lemnae]
MFTTECKRTLIAYNIIRLPAPNSNCETTSSQFSGYYIDSSENAKILNQIRTIQAVYKRPDATPYSILETNPIAKKRGLLKQKTDQVH